MRLNGKRIFAAMLALALVVCTFASCGDNAGEEEITRGANAIASPSTTRASTTAGTTTTTAPATTAPSTTRRSSSGSNNNSNNNNNNAGMNTGDIAADSGASLKLVASLINAFGYNYDAEQGVFYTEIDSWQRSANYIQHYDALAPLGNMRFQTTRVDFTTDGLDWRIQLWKGQYGVFGGAEIGIYNKIPGQTEELYYCVDDDHMMYMSYTMYLTPADYRSGNAYFTRGWQKHWWLTGFKVGTVTPAEMVMSARIRTFNGAMATAMESGLQGAGFREGNATTQYDTYRRSGFDFYILWYQAGVLNY
ncbi:MAG TPA: DUF4474 domain-containing protein [Candidatus Fimenecus stercoravium]|nr:DUF4474 domain-containing protein [Candidatus Fimenecus stercoravium]